MAQSYDSFAIQLEQQNKRRSIDDLPPVKSHSYVPAAMTIISQNYKIGTAIAAVPIGLFADYLTPIDLRGTELASMSANHIIDILFAQREGKDNYGTTGKIASAISGVLYDTMQHSGYVTTWATPYAVHGAVSGVAGLVFSGYYFKYSTAESKFSAFKSEYLTAWNIVAQIVKLGLIPTNMQVYQWIPIPATSSFLLVSPFVFASQEGNWFKDHSTLTMGMIGVVGATIDTFNYVKSYYSAGGTEGNTLFQKLEPDALKNDAEKFINFQLDYFTRAAQTLTSYSKNILEYCKYQETARVNAFKAYTAGEISPDSIAYLESFMSDEWKWLKRHFIKEKGQDISLVNKVFGQVTPELMTIITQKINNLKANKDNILSPSTLLTTPINNPPSDGYTKTDESDYASLLNISLEGKVYSGLTTSETFNTYCKDHCYYQHNNASNTYDLHCLGLDVNAA